MEFDVHAADSGITLGDTDLRVARLIILDGDTCSDGESVHIQIKRAAVLSVKREGSLLQQKCHKMDLSVLYKEGSSSHSHYSEVLDPPVSTQTDEGITNGQSDTRPRNQTHCRLW